MFGSKICSCLRWSWTSKGHHNFLLQHETRKMGVVVTVVIQRRWTTIFNRHPDLIAFFQVQRRLEGQWTPLINGALHLLNITRHDYIPIQKKKKTKPNRRWRYKTRRSREREKINSRSRCRENPRCQIHGVSLVHSRKIERDRNVLCVKWRISLDVEIDGRRFDVGVSNPTLKTFFIKLKIRKLQLNNWWESKTFTLIVREFSEIAVNGFHFRRSHDRIKSVQGVAN